MTATSWTLRWRPARFAIHQENGSEPCELARLHRYRPKRDPRPVATARHADDQDHHERDKPCGVDGGRHAFIDIEPQLCHQPQDHETGSTPQNLPQQEVRSDDPGNRVQRGQRHTKQRDHGKQHPGIETMFHGVILPALRKWRRGFGRRSLRI